MRELAQLVAQSCVSCLLVGALGGCSGAADPDRGPPEDSRWAVERVADDAAFASIVVSGDGRAHVLYWQLGGEQRIAHRSPEDWHTETIWHGGGRGVLAKDERGEVHAAFSMVSGVAHARAVDGEWRTTLSREETSETTVGGVSMTVHEGQAFVAYGAAEPGPIMPRGEDGTHGHYAGPGVVRLATFGATDAEPDYTSVASYDEMATLVPTAVLGEDPLVLFVDPEGQLVAARPGDGAAMVSDAPGVVVGFTARLDDAGRIHVAAYDGGAVVYGHEDREGWQWEEVDAVVARDPALALGSDGTVHIAYTDTEAEQIRYARRGPSDWETERVSQGAEAGVAIALDSAGRPHIAFDRCGDTTCSVSYATRREL